MKWIKFTWMKLTIKNQMITHWENFLLRANF